MPCSGLIPYYDYETPTNDCPRIYQSRVWAVNWTGIYGVPSQVATTYGVDNDGGHRLTFPDGTVYKEFYGTTWQLGLTTVTKSYATIADANNDSESVPTWKKKTTTNY